jgi:hypothetical protein
MNKIYLDDVIYQFETMKRQAERAIAQVSDTGFFRTLDNDANSIGIIVKHLTGNMRSRWTDFLTADGEKPDRHRDSEFELYQDDKREQLMKSWETNWQLVLNTVRSLAVEDLTKSVRIRTEELSVVAAINRQLTHYSAHIGQIILLARHFAGDEWQTLSVARGKSEEHNREMFGSQ